MVDPSPLPKINQPNFLQISKGLSEIFTIYAVSLPLPSTDHRHLLFQTLNTPLNEMPLKIQQHFHFFRLTGGCCVVFGRGERLPDQMHRQKQPFYFQQFLLPIAGGDLYRKWDRYQEENTKAKRDSNLIFINVSYMYAKKSNIRSVQNKIRFTTTPFQEPCFPKTSSTMAHV